MSKIKWSLKTYKISDLTDYYKNPRQLTEKQFNQLKKSIDKFGMIDKPIINADAKNTIIGGHQRLNVLRAGESESVECWVPDHELDEKEVEELNIRLNKNTGEWDFDVLANEWNFDDLIDWGFDERELMGSDDLEDDDEKEMKPEQDEKLDKPYFQGVGQYGIPPISSVSDIDSVKWIPFNFAKTAKETEGVGIHFFLDDYQFLRLWNNPEQYSGLLSKFDYIMSPDFSTFTSMPKALQIFNHYRKHWLGFFFQLRGITVIPTISWSDESSFEWCFDGEPDRSVVAVSTVGVMTNQSSKKLFLAGYERMKQKLNPSKILCYGKLLPELESETEYIGCYYEKIVAERKAKNGR